MSKPLNAADLNRVLGSLSPRNAGSAFPPAHPAAPAFSQAPQSQLIRPCDDRLADLTGDGNVIRASEEIIARPRCTDTAPAERRATTDAE